MRRPADPVRFTPFARCRSIVALFAASVVFASGQPAFAQAKAASKGREIEEKTLTTSDGASLAVTYYKSNKGKESPAVILLHQERSSKIVWKNSFAERLQDEGYGVVAVDLRRHGLNAAGNDNPSLSANDYAMMRDADLEAVKSFLMDENEKQALNVRKTAIVAAGMSGPVAVNFAANDWAKSPHDDAPVDSARTPRGQDIRALVLLAPEKNLPKMQCDTALKFLRDPSRQVAVFVGYGDRDKKGKAGNDEYKKQLTNNGKDKAERFLFEEYKTNDHGTDMLGHKLRVEEHIIGFLKKYLADLNGPEDAWRTRKSRLDSK